MASATHADLTGRWLAVKYAVSNWICAGEPLSVTFERLARLTEQAGGLRVSMHVSDSNRLPPGRGHIDFARLLAALRKIGYQGALVLEPVPPGSDPLLSTSFPGNHRLRDLFAEEGLRHLKGMEAALEV